MQPTAKRLTSPGPIALLDEVTINQMAAGEVVERPASVAKELVENAFDAGATQVDVQVEGGGLDQLIVIDNGSGMAPEDANRCILRHATSKLRRVEDLTVLTTLGFRGEALSSIAAVAKLTLTTRPRGSDLGYRLEVHGGVVQSARSVGCAEGTQIVVSDLFYNVPARRKFMRGKATEQAHVQEALLKVALASRRGGLRLRAKERTLLDVPDPLDAATRAQLALGQKLGTTALIDFEAHGISVSGVLAAQSLERGEGRRLWLFVNGRFVRDRSLQRAALAACKARLAPSTPTALIYVDLPAGGVDVNVHPQKSEVRFVQTAAVHEAVTLALAAAADAWHKADWLRQQAQMASPQRAPEPAVQLAHSFSGQRAFPGATGSAWRAPRGAAAGSLGNHRHLGPRAAAGAASAHEPRPIEVGAGVAPEATRAQPSLGGASLLLPELADALQQPAQSRWQQLVPLGLAPAGYLCCREGDKLALVNLTRAWRAVLVHALTADAPAATAAPGALICSDTLMMPPAWTPQPELLAAAEDYLIETAKSPSPWGLQLEAVGPGAFVVVAVPTALTAWAPALVAQSLIEVLRHEPQGAARAFAERRRAVVGRWVDGLLNEGLPIRAGAANVWGPGFLRQLHAAQVTFGSGCVVVLDGESLVPFISAL